jgi:hypothetical protein
MPAKNRYHSSPSSRSIGDDDRGFHRAENKESVSFACRQLLVQQHKKQSGNTNSLYTAMHLRLGHSHIYTGNSHTNKHAILDSYLRTQTHMSVCARNTALVLQRVTVAYAQCKQ